MAYTGEKKRQYQREWVAKRRAAYLSDKSCIKCGASDSLEVDHIDPSEKVSHSIWSWSVKRRDAELSKCQILCAPCHKIKTRNNGDKAHGERVGNSVFTDLEVEELRKLYSSGEYTFKQLGAMFSKKPDSIRYSVTRGGWQHV